MQNILHTWLAKDCKLLIGLFPPVMKYAVSDVLFLEKGNVALKEGDTLYQHLGICGV